MESSFGCFTLAWEYRCVYFLVVARVAELYPCLKLPLDKPWQFSGWTTIAYCLKKKLNWGGGGSMLGDYSKLLV